MHPVVITGSPVYLRRYLSAFSANAADEVDLDSDSSPSSANWASVARSTIPGDATVASNLDRLVLSLLNDVVYPPAANGLPTPSAASQPNGLV